MSKQKRRAINRRVRANDHPPHAGSGQFVHTHARKKPFLYIADPRVVHGEGGALTATLGELVDDGAEEDEDV